jgi:hypothetical protein
MKKIILGILFFIVPVWVTAQTVPVPGAEISVQEIKQRKKMFKERRNEIRKLVKQYKKAPEAEKQVIKTRLEELVSQNVDTAIRYAKERLAQEKDILAVWEQKLKTDEKNLPQLKAQQVDDLLAGTAKEKHKQAKKRWKTQVKAMKKRWK